MALKLHKFQSYKQIVEIEYQAGKWLEEVVDEEQGNPASVQELKQTVKKQNK